MTPAGAAPDPASPGRVLCTGKLPAYGDFVRAGPHSAAARALDRWFQQGLYQARAHLHRRLDLPGDAAPAYRCLFCPEEGDTMLPGVLRLSRDRAGRPYPFLVATEVVRDERPVHHHMPRLLGQGVRFFGQAGDLVGRATRGHVSHRDVPALLEHVDPTGFSPGGGRSPYERFLQEVTFAQFVARIWGDFEDTRKYLLFKNLLDVVRPLRRGAPARCALGLRFRLGGYASSPEEAVGFWLELTLRLLDAPGFAPTLFWTAEAGHGSGDPHLLLFLRPPEPNAFVHLLPVEPDATSLCDLEALGRDNAARAALSIPARYGALLESEPLTLHAFLQHLGQEAV